MSALRPLIILMRSSLLIIASRGLAGLMLLLLLCTCVFSKIWVMFVLLFAEASCIKHKFCVCSGWSFYRFHSLFALFVLRFFVFLYSLSLVFAVLCVNTLCAYKLFMLKAPLVFCVYISESCHSGCIRRIFEEFCVKFSHTNL
jgi:hypothetical protein